MNDNDFKGTKIALTYMEQKQIILLDEVTLMRTILALLIVFKHSFACFQGSC